MEEFQVEDKEDGIQENKCTKVEDKKPLPVARNRLWIEEEPCSTVTATSNSVRLPTGLQDLGDDNDTLPYKINLNRYKCLDLICSTV